MTEEELEITRRYIEYTRDQTALRPRATVLLPIALALTVIGLPLAIWLGARLLTEFRHRRALRRGLLRFANRAVPVMSYPVHALSEVFWPGSRVTAVVVIFSFDPGAQNTHRMADIAMRIIESRSAPFRDELVALMKEGRRDRVLLPREICGDIDVYIAPLLLHSYFLRGTVLDIGMIPLMVDPAPHGRMETIPWWLFINDPEERRRALSEHDAALAVQSRGL